MTRGSLKPVARIIYTVLVETLNHALSVYVSLEKRLTSLLAVMKFHFCHVGELVATPLTVMWRPLVNVFEKYLVVSFKHVQTAATVRVLWITGIWSLRYMYLVATAAYDHLVYETVVWIEAHRLCQQSHSASIVSPQR